MLWVGVEGRTTLLGRADERGTRDKDKCHGDVDDGGGGSGAGDDSGTTRKIIKYRSYFYLASANIVPFRSDKLRVCGVCRACVFVFGCRRQTERNVRLVVFRVFSERFPRRRRCARDDGDEDHGHGDPAYFRSRALATRVVLSDVRWCHRRSLSSRIRRSH